MHDENATAAISPLLQSWLNAATRDLCESAQTRIKAEIADHVDNACAELRQQGVPEELLIHKVLESLGDPDAARARYVRLNFTRDEYKTLQRLRLTAIIFEWISVISLVLIAGMAWLIGPINTLLVYVLLQFALPVLMLRIARRQPDATGDKVRIFAVLAFFLVSATFQLIRAVIDREFSTAIFGLCLVTLSVPYVQLAPKLWRGSQHDVGVQRE